MCVSVVIARDEERGIAKVLKSLRYQTLRPYIIVVDDGSIDRTPEIASDLSDYLIRLPRHKRPWAGMPLLARVFNAGFEVARELDPDFVLVSGSDAIYPLKYIETIIRRMKKHSVVVASGVAENERAKCPRGSGRIIDARWFNLIGFKYPENWGFESYIIFKALSMGYRVQVYHDIHFKLIRETMINPLKAYYWGLGMRALGYWTPYALYRIVFHFLKSPLVAIYMFKGYSNKGVEKYKDIVTFVSTFQKSLMIYKLNPLAYLSEFKEFLTLPSISSY